MHINWDKTPLIPAIAQDVKTGDVLMPSSWHPWLVIGLTILFSLSIGFFLRYA